MLQPDWSEFFPLVVVFLLSLISPGADFLLVVRQAVLYGRKTACLSSLGIGAGLFVHVSYTILGLGFIVINSVWLFHIIKWAGAVYLVFLGIHALKAKGRKTKGGGMPIISSQADTRVEQSLLRALMLGVGINLLNPKVMLFFLSIFSVLVAPTTGVPTQFFYGLILIILTVFWFVFVSFIMTTARVRYIFSHLSKWIDRFSGLVFIGLGIRLMFQKI